MPRMFFHGPSLIWFAIQFHFEWHASRPLRADTNWQWVKFVYHILALLPTRIPKLINLFWKIPENSHYVSSFCVCMCVLWLHFTVTVASWRRMMTIIAWLISTAIFSHIIWCSLLLRCATHRMFFVGISKKKGTVDRSRMAAHVACLLYIC